MRARAGVSKRSRTVRNCSIGGVREGAEDCAITYELWMICNMPWGAVVLSIRPEDAILRPKRFVTERTIIPDAPYLGMPQRSDQRNPDSFADDFTETLQDDASEQEPQSSSFVQRAKRRTVSIFSPRVFLVALALLGVGMVAGNA